MSRKNKLSRRISNKKFQTLHVLGLISPYLSTHKVRKMLGKSSTNAALALILVASMCCNNNSGPNNTSPTPEKLVWSEEFNYNGLPDSSKWNYDVGGNGWGNRELQYYSNKRTENARVENGNLVIEARKENYWPSNQYTSARLVTKKKADWQYGRIEVRA